MFNADLKKELLEVKKDVLELAKLVAEFSKLFKAVHGAQSTINRIVEERISQIEKSVETKVTK